MRWLPRLRWRPLTEEEMLQLDLPVRWPWECFELAWFDFGFVFVARPAK